MNELFYHLYDFLKNAIVLIVTTLFTIYMQLEDVYILIFFAFVANIAAGIYTDVNVNNKPFKIDKAFEAFKHFGFYVFLVYFIYSTGVRTKDEYIQVLGVKWTTLIVIYFYITNILRNGTLIWPDNKTIAFLYLVFSTQIFDRLKSALGFKDNNNKDNEL